jgi:hypothetical protein
MGAAPDWLQIRRALASAHRVKGAGGARGSALGEASGQAAGGGALHGAARGHAAISGCPCGVRSAQLGSCRRAGGRVTVAAMWGADDLCANLSERAVRGRGWQPACGERSPVPAAATLSALTEAAVPVAAPWASDVTRSSLQRDGRGGGGEWTEPDCSRRPFNCRCRPRSAAQGAKQGGSSGPAGFMATNLAALDRLLPARSSSTTRAKGRLGRRAMGGRRGGGSRESAGQGGTMMRTAGAKWVVSDNGMRTACPAMAPRQLSSAAPHADPSCAPRSWLDCRRKLQQAQWQVWGGLAEEFHGRRTAQQLSSAASQLFS